MNTHPQKYHLIIAILAIWATAATLALIVSKTDPDVVWTAEQESVVTEPANAFPEESAEAAELVSSQAASPAGTAETVATAGVPAKAEPEPRLASKKAKQPRPPLATFHDVGEICIDAQTGDFLTGTAPDAPCPPASVTKVMTLYLVFDALDRGQISLDDIVTVSKRAEDMGGTQLYLSAGEQASVRDLIFGLMLQSANDGAVALAEHVSGNVEAFVQKMNETARELGMTKTHFVTPHGLPPSRKLKNADKDLTTARDLATLTCHLLRRFPDALEYSSTRTREFPANAKRSKPMPMSNHNKLLIYFEGCDGFKTGWTNDGASIVTTASRGNKRVIAVVLGGLVKNRRGEIDAKTSQVERNQRAAELMYRGFEMLDVLKYEATPYSSAK
ncbi:MAG: D-alanyl-D-alanine carboxypeptidase [Opitutales bacterium]|nr:D-alanyl-D-alanine carboxypeptidase [Opitutales bacterium]